MELTSGALIATLSAVVVTMMTATIWLWPKVAGSTPAKIAARLGLLLACQLSLTLALSAGMNAYWLFYADWQDLLGTAKGPVDIAAGRQADTTPIRQPLGRARSEQLDHGPKKGHPEKNGRLESLRLEGERTGLGTMAYVYLPPQYFQRAYEHSRFPVIVALTGYPGSQKALVTKFRLPELAAKEVAAGRARPAVYVMMRPTVVPPRDTECVDVPGGPQVETFFTQDLPDILRSNYRLATDRHGWGIMGDSTGGYCAVKLAMRHSDTYVAATSIAGQFVALSDATTGDLYGGSKAYRNDNDLLWRLQHLPPPPVSVLVTSSQLGEKTYPQAKRFLALARPPLQADSIILPVGGHNFTTFRRVLPQVVRWMSAHLQTPVEPPRPLHGPSRVSP